MMTNKKPSPDFLLRLVGNDLRPWGVPLRTLSRVLAAVQRLVEQRDDLAYEEEEEEEAPAEPPCGELRTLQLIDVKSKSAGYLVASNNRDATLSILREAGRSLHEPDRAPWHPSTISSMEALSQIARQLACIVEFRTYNGRQLGDVIAVIRPDTFGEIQRRAFARGRTSVYGRLERVGGATATKCGIHVHGRPRMLFCQVSDADLVRELGKFIYTDVVLSGEAVWYKYNNQLRSLRVTSFSPAKVGSFEEVARKIRAAVGGNAWDRIADPDAYIRDMRG